MKNMVKNEIVLLDPYSEALWGGGFAITQFQCIVAHLWLLPAPAASACDNMGPAHKQGNKQNTATDKIWQTLPPNYNYHVARKIQCDAERAHKQGSRAD